MVAMQGREQSHCFIWLVNDKNKAQQYLLLCLIFIIKRDRGEKKMTLEVLAGEYSVCKVKNMDDIPWEGEFIFVSKTDKEMSLVCLSSNVPTQTEEQETGWRVMRIQGTLEFSQIGIISVISSLLAAEKISIFVISTYDTDYILVKKQTFEKTKIILEKNNYIIKE